MAVLSARNRTFLATGQFHSGWRVRHALSVQAIDCGTPDQSLGNSPLRHIALIGQCVQLDGSPLFLLIAAVALVVDQQFQHLRT